MDPTLSMKDVQEQTGITGHTLRYYEKAGLLNDIGRLENGHRFYTEFDIEWIKTLMLLRSTGMPIQKMLDLAKLKDEGEASIEKRIAYFKAYQQELREQIAMREEAIRTMDKKIKRHEMLLAKRDKER
ncbi:MAG TPA: MerR family transcriptional regulator [Candidatus Saccharimonadales bacterium]|nr:MerR family transcriptional regulator [Candidatus Saccharimonadales bacterium]